MSDITKFNNQFPTGKVTETIKTEYSTEKETFVGHGLNIGWAMDTVNTYKPHARSEKK